MLYLYMEVSEQQILKNILEIRTKQRFTQNYLGELLGIDGATYSRIEKGGIALSYSKLAEIAKALNVSAIDIITYPKIYIDKDNTNIQERISVTFEISSDKREHLLKMVTGEK
ncbi:helix-turn-helix domain-containing protein [Flavobacterium praedii]|uniref:helix-turn-helix domain-containing protein n=1 Tax=Flavobacterium praedii TaxID=3002900 RepID=UPI002481ED8C|nr:helix-turn-helix transcriptional regulator [Flavobacterium praedii]